MYTWILSTGWWVGRAPINSDAVVIVGLLCICLVLGFVYINRCELCFIDALCVFTLLLINIPGLGIMDAHSQQVGYVHSCKGDLDT